MFIYFRAFGCLEELNNTVADLCVINPLFDVQGRARLLYNAGYHTLKDLANAKIQDLAACVPHLSFRNASQIISSAKVY